MKIKYAINLHKGATPLVVLALMAFYENFGIGAWVYLALHGTYGILWLLKDRIFPDRQWEEEVTIGLGITTFMALLSYWVAPFLLISQGIEPPNILIAAAIALNILGVFLHYASDAQKYYTLKYRKGLITEGFFARCRNTNYLGEVLIYLAFAILAMHWLPFVILGGFVAGIFIPNMQKKDRSLSRYPEFTEYKAQSGLILPNLLSPKKPNTSLEEG